MFGQKVWRLVAVAVIMSAAAFLPQGVAVAATPGTIDTVTCSQLSAELREGALNCSPLRHCRRRRASRKPQPIRPRPRPDPMPPHFRPQRPRR